VVDAHIINYYPNVEPTQELVEQIQDYILDELNRVKAEADSQADVQSRRRIKLEKQQAKLLEVYYADAIPVELMKTDQKRIEGAIKALDRQIISSIEDHEQVVANLKAALEFAGNLAGAYCHASDEVRRQ